MNAKTIITLIVGIAGLGITAWKGPTVWGTVSAGASGIALLIGTLFVLPAKDEEYIQDLESALVNTANTPAAAERITIALRSAERFAFAAVGVQRTELKEDTKP